MDYPLVSILTPVYNCERYLVECIESVLNQTYKNWEYIIINNCSTDSTLAIASRYADSDSRIRIVTNQSHVGAIENHNIALGLIPPESVYCKVVSADDTIAPDCVEKLVRLAERYRSVGIVGSYQRRGSEVQWTDLPKGVEFLSGREASRLTLVGNVQIFGNPTSLLYRASLVRQNNPFFPHTLPHADTSACFKYLQFCDFGFVHEVLSMERIHDGQVSSKVRAVHMNNAACLDDFLRYGPVYLNDEEFEVEKKRIFEGYFRWLAGCVLKMEGREFWKYQSRRLRELGYPIDLKKVLLGVIGEIVEESRNPRLAFRKVVLSLKRYV
jgi:glycosyltransferase involved in cell wall biosynthesis